MGPGLESDGIEQELLTAETGASERVSLRERNTGLCRTLPAPSHKTLVDSPVARRPEGAGSEPCMRCER